MIQAFGHYFSSCIARCYITFYNHANKEQQNAGNDPHVSIALADRTHHVNLCQNEEADLCKVLPIEPLLNQTNIWAA